MEADVRFAGDAVRRVAGGAGVTAGGRRVQGTAGFMGVLRAIVVDVDHNDRAPAVVTDALCI